MNNNYFDSEESHLLGAHFITIVCPTVELEISGSCPVQAFGKIGEDKFYFRARWDSYRLEIYNKENESEIIWYKNGIYKNSSWMPLDFALKIIGKNLQLFWFNLGADRQTKENFGEELLKKYKQKIKE